MIVAIGTPCYRMQVRAEHAMMLCELGEHSGRGDGHAIGVKIYLHTSVLPAGRADVLYRAMLSDAHALLSIDADTWLETRTLITCLDEAQRLFGAHRDIAAMGVAVPQDDNMVNVWSGPGQRIARKDFPVGKPRPVFAMGAGCTIHNLEWHRTLAVQKVALADFETGPNGEPVKPPSTWPWTAYATVPTGMPRAFFGEDHVYCQRVADEGGRVMAILPARGVYHASFGG